ncbi:MAG: hypothetical protein ACLU0O_00600 [Collinsella sp.]
MAAVNSVEFWDQNITNHIDVFKPGAPIVTACTLPRVVSTCAQYQAEDQWG